MSKRHKEATNPLKPHSGASRGLKTQTVRELNQQMKLEMSLPQKISLNELYSVVHWHIRKEHKDTWSLLTKIAVRKSGIKPVTKLPASVTYQFYIAGRQLDTVNHAYMIKLLEDGMISAGLFKDDSSKYIGDVTIKKAIKSPRNKVIIYINE